MEKIINFKISEELRARFKASAAQNRESLQEAFTQLVNYYIDNPMEQKDESED